MCLYLLFLQSLLGDFQYKIVFLCKSLSEVNCLLRDVFEGASEVFTDKLIAPRTTLHLFPRRYLDEANKQRSVITLQSDGEVYSCMASGRVMVAILS